jgi:phosphinothricin acetyltransferase
LVAEESGRVIGYAYSNPHRARAAYQWSAESSIYLSEAARGKGLARELYDRIFALLRLQGIRMVMAGATLPNPPSEKFHSGYGFQTVGVYPRVGYKFEAWHDVGWWYKEIPQQSGRPDAFRAFPELSPEELSQVLGI